MTQNDNNSTNVNPAAGSDVRWPRTGNGFDVHRLVEGRRCIICGVDIPHGKGLLGHSDADVAVHALIDALLGAAALGDIGALFPDTDAAYKDIDSMVLLQRTMQCLAAAGFAVVNADITVIAQAPKMRPHITAMRQNLARVMGVGTDRISVKATTTEHLGFAGRGEGIAAMATATVV